MTLKQFTLGTVATLFCSYTFAADTITISSQAQYEDDRVIATNILEECTELGAQFSDSTQKFLEKYGWDVSKTIDEEAGNEGRYLKLEIVDAISAGNAFIGHRKSVAISAELFENGELVDTFSATRDSGGGFMGGFKGSCSVLHRCVNTLGNDVAKWVRRKAD